MRTTRSAGIGPQHNPITRCRAIAMALFSLVLVLGANGLAGSQTNGNLPEFQLPSLEVDGYRLDLELPFPIKMKPPSVHQGLIGTEVTMTFYILKSGKVRVIGDNASYFNRQAFELASLMNYTMKTWQFDPARDKDGNAISVKVKLPVEVIPFRKESGDRFVSLSMKRPVIVGIAQG